MQVDDKVKAEIRRAFNDQAVSFNALAERYGIHHSTVKRIVASRDLIEANNAWRSGQSIWESFQNEIVFLLEQYPKITSSRLLNLLQDRYYATGKITSLRAYLRKLDLRPKQRESFILRELLIGEEAQVDWAHFGKITVEGISRPLYAFVMVLSWSRQAYVEFTLDMTAETFFNCHTNAFRSFGGVPLAALYDNLKAVVVKRDGDLIKYNPLALSYADQFRYEIRVCNVRRGNEKGRVERRIRHIRDSFFVAREVLTISQLNEEVQDWIVKKLGKQRQTQDQPKLISEAFEEEKQRLKPLPDFQPILFRKKYVRAPKYAFVRFDTNRYSIPPGHTSKLLRIEANHEFVNIFNDDTLLASHRRYWGKNKERFDSKHFEMLKTQKKKGVELMNRHRLLSSSPEMLEIYSKMLESGLNKKQASQRLIELIEEFGSVALSLAAPIALTRQLSSPESIRRIITNDLKAKPINRKNHPIQPLPEIIIQAHDIRQYRKLEEPI